jgi:multidrug efflux pump subunit AcrA (membrane-fusion protein)
VQAISDADLAQQLREQSSRLAQLRATHAALEQQITGESAALTALQQELRRRNLTAAQAAARGVDWPELLLEGKGMLHHKDRERILSALGLTSFGFFPETLQRCVALQVARDRSDEVDNLMESLDVVMPHVLPVDGWCSIKVLEHSHSGENYHLRFLPDRSQYQVVNLRLRTPDIELTTADLRDALTHIQRHHFFDDAPRWC